MLLTSSFQHPSSIFQLFYIKRHAVKLPAPSIHLPALLKKQTDHQVNKLDADKRGNNTA